MLVNRSLQIDFIVFQPGEKIKENSSNLYFIIWQVFYSSGMEMAKISLDQLTLIDLTEGAKKPFARKVVVVAYHLKKHKSGIEIPHFLFTVIAPKQPSKVTDNWRKAKHFNLPSGFSLIKGTREMIRRGRTEDIAPGFGEYCRKMRSGNLKKKEVDNSVDGTVPAVISALREAREEGGIKLNNIELIFDLGVKKIKMDGRNLKANVFAIELKRPKNGKAIDSLAIEYFTLGELELAANLRTRYNIPLVRPSHMRFVQDMVPVLHQHYELEGRLISDKRASKKKNNKRKALFVQLVKDAREGRFRAHKYSVKKTIKNIIERSVHSREKQKKGPMS